MNKITLFYFFHFIKLPCTAQSNDVRFKEVNYTLETVADDSYSLGMAWLPDGSMLVH
jgi:hypothetical protein